MNAIHGLIPAGGVGARAQQASAKATPLPTPKQYRLINGHPMIVRAVQALLADARIEDVVVGVQVDDTQASNCLADLARTRVCPSAGPTRALTVLQTLKHSGFDDSDWVLVHDAARPGLPADRLSALIDCCLAHDQGGLLAMPAADTVKLARLPDEWPEGSPKSSAAQVQSTLARQTIWLAQTPQMFRVGALAQALSDAIDAGVDVTDEASAMEWAGHAPLLVQGSSRNFKVTWPEDFDRMEGLA